jgi:hypothetical protein
LTESHTSVTDALTDDSLHALREDFSAGTVDQLLVDAGHADVPELRAAVLSIASLAQLQAPAPGPELALMLAGPRDELSRQRWQRKHRPAVVELAVLAGTSARDNTSPTGKSRVPGATLNGNPGQSNQGKVNHGKAGVGRR